MSTRGLRRRAWRQPFRRIPLPLCAALLTVFAGCRSGNSAAQFPYAGPEIVWPRPPDASRIRYLGEIVGEASLAIHPRGLDVLRDALAGPRPPAAFSKPMAVAVSGERIFVADAGLACVHVLDFAERRYRAITSGGGRPLRWPIDVAICGDRLAIADSVRPGVFFYSLDGAERGALSGFDMKRPSGLAWDCASGELWVVDSGAHAIVVVDAAGAARRRLGGRGKGTGELNFPTGAIHGGDLGVAVADAMNFRVQLYDAAGNPIRAFGKKGDAAGDFALPRDAAWDSQGHLYVLDNQFENVQVFDAEGLLLMAWGEEGSGPGQFNLPSGITIDERDRIWIADTYNRRVQVFEYLRQSADRTEVEWR